MLVTMKEMLVRASKEGYAVAAPNMHTEMDARASIEVAEEISSPIILDVGFSANPDIDLYGDLLRRMAEKSTVPVAINLDHGKTYEQCVRAVAAGFTGVMLDRSALPYEDNVRDVSQVVEMAHAAGVSVEAELGHVGQAGNYAEDGNASLTTPEDAARFVEETDVDCLAVAIGTAHGAYPKGEVPYIRHKNLAAIKETVGADFPLVLHGASGTAEEDLKQVCANGINKINIASDLMVACTSALNERHLEGQEAYEMWRVIIGAWKEKLSYVMSEIYGSAGKAWEVGPAGVSGTAVGSMVEK